MDITLGVIKRKLENIRGKEIDEGLKDIKEIKQFLYQKKYRRIFNKEKLNNNLKCGNLNPNLTKARLQYKINNSIFNLGENNGTQIAGKNNRVVQNEGNYAKLVIIIAVTVIIIVGIILKYPYPYVKDVIEKFLPLLIF